MYVRLGFSVAAHLEPDILIVDEVLAVGDAEFRQKALGKMQDASKEEGRTVLFVSHNMAAIRQLCTKCILIEKGSLKEIGQTERIVKNYLGNIYESNRSDSNKAEYQYEKFDDEKDVELIKACVMDTTGLVRNHFSCDEPITIRFSYNIRKIISDLYGYLQISTVDEVVVMISVSNDMEVDPINGLALGLQYVDIDIPSRSLGHGRYNIRMRLSVPNSFDYVLADHSTELNINLADDSTIRGDKRDGFFSTLCSWKVDNGRDSIEINK
jgi:lipopolysaccharide transport system ATP-binding protein